MTIDPVARLSCPHAEVCAGCSLIAMPYAEQLAHKHGRVARGLSRYDALAALALPAVLGAEPNAGYRTRAKLVVGESGELGLYATGTHRVVDIPACRVLAPVVESVVRELRAIAAEGAPGLSAVDVRELRAGGEPSAIVTLIGELRADVQRRLVERVRAVASVAGVAVSRRDARAVRVLGGVPEPVHGEALFADRLSEGEPHALVAHGSFVQTHRGQAARIAQRVLAELGDPTGKRVLELYGGSGFVALSLAKRGADVTWVESFRPAADACERAAREQGLGERVHVRAGDASDELTALVPDDGSTRARFDAVIVNPPRRGVAPAVRTGIARLRPALLAYVSCEPETLARDLAAFAQLGMCVRAMQPFDMIPQSAEVETLVLLEPGVPPRLQVLYEDDELLVLHKPPHLPTTPHPGHASSVLVRAVEEHQLAREHAAAVHRLDAGTSGVCLIAKRRDAVAAWSQALARGRKTYVALVRGVTHKKGKITRPLQERGRALPATTRYVRKRVVGGHSLLHVAPEEGRTHQIRRHVASLGHPVLGDGRYGHAPSNRHFQNARGLDRTFLHLEQLELVHPRTGQALRFEAALAGDLEAVLAMSYLAA